MLYKWRMSSLGSSTVNTTSCFALSHLWLIPQFCCKLNHSIKSLCRWSENGQELIPSVAQETSVCSVLTVISALKYRSIYCRTSTNFSNQLISRGTYLLVIKNTILTMMVHQLEHYGFQSVLFTWVLARVFQSKFFAQVFHLKFFSQVLTPSFLFKLLLQVSRSVLFANLSSL